MLKQNKYQKTQNYLENLDSLCEETDKIEAEIQSGSNGYDILETVKQDDLKKIVKYCVTNGVALSGVLKEIKIIINKIQSSHKEMSVLVAGPKFSAKILQILPVGGILLGFLMGVNVLNELFASLVGVFLLLGGAAFWFLGNLITQKMLERFENMLKCDDLFLDERVQLKMIECALNCGQNILQTFENSQIEGLRSFAQGVPWEVCNIKKSYQCLYDSFILGVSPNKNIQNLISELNQTKNKQFREAGEKLSVKMIMPLGLCYLPSFILLGVVPIMTGMLKIV